MILHYPFEEINDGKYNEYKTDHQCKDFFRVRIFFLLLRYPGKLSTRIVIDTYGFLILPVKKVDQ